jgi:predicted CopG family antitoxin
MPNRLRRTEILLDPAQHQELTVIAQLENRSMSEVVREMLHQQLAVRRQNAELAKQRQLAVLDEIDQHRQAILERRGGKPINSDVVALIDQMREERDAEIDTLAIDQLG